MRRGLKWSTVSHELFCGVVFQGSVPLLFPCTPERCRPCFPPRDVVIIVTKGEVWCNNSNLCWGFGLQHMGIFTSLVNHMLGAVYNCWLVRLFFIMASSPHCLIGWDTQRQKTSYWHPFGERPPRVWAHLMIFRGTGWIYIHMNKHLPDASILNISHNNQIWD